MRVDVPLGEHLRLVAYCEAPDNFRVSLSGTLDQVAGPLLAAAIREFFVPGASIVLDLTGVASYDPSTTVDLFALRREAKVAGARLGFAGAEAGPVVHLRRHVDLTVPAHVPQQRADRDARGTELAGR